MNEIKKAKIIDSPYDIISVDIIDFNRLNGYWENTAKAIDTIFSWFNGMAYLTESIVLDYYSAPYRNDFPGWKHIGNHEEEGRTFWNWFFLNFPNGELNFSDEPDFYGCLDKTLDSPGYFRGDIGKVSASCFALVQKNLRKNELWISVDGDRHITIEPLYDICNTFAALLTEREKQSGQMPLWSDT